MSGERVSCERVSCEQVSCERLSCERVSCERVSCERVSGERVSGERVSCERVSGERVSGERVSCERVSCERVSCEQVSCERVSCEQVIDEIHRYHNIGDVGNETIRGNYLAGNSKDGFTNPEFLKVRFRHTSDIINAVNEGTFPNQAMLNFHPQRWNDAFVPWVKELVWQNVKNQGKWLLKAVRGER